MHVYNCRYVCALNCLALRPTDPYTIKKSLWAETSDGEGLNTVLHMLFRDTAIA